MTPAQALTRIHHTLIDDEWRYEGSPDITVWCPRCRCRVIAHGSGHCLWCDTQVPAPPRRKPAKPSPELAVGVPVWDRDAIARWRQEVGL